MIKIELVKGIRSCGSCDAINYKPTISYNARIVEKLYEIRIGYSVLCLCGECLRELRILANQYESEGADDD